MLVGGAARRYSKRCRPFSSFARPGPTRQTQASSVLISAKEEGKRICGYGAPGKGNTLLNYVAIGTDFSISRSIATLTSMAVTRPACTSHLAGRGDRRRQARLHSDPSVESQGRDRAADAPCRQMGRQVYRSHSLGLDRRERDFFLRAAPFPCGWIAAPWTVEKVPAVSSLRAKGQSLAFTEQACARALPVATPLDHSSQVSGS